MRVNVRERFRSMPPSFKLVKSQGGFAFFVTLHCRAAVVSRDLRNNALPLYLCRPFSRTEYVAGKMSVVLI